MKQTRKTEVKVGLSLLLSVIILLWVIAWSKNVDLFSENKELTISFNSVAGLEVGDQVNINGVRKGYIDNIEIDGNEVDVKTILYEDVDIRKDARFSIMMLDLMGGKKIEIAPGSSSVEIDYSVIQKGTFAGDVSTAMAKLASMEKNIKTIIEELTITLNAVNNIIDDKEFTSDLKSSAKQLNNLSSKVSLMLEENRVGIKSLIDSTRVLVATSNNFLQENSSALSNSIDQASKLLNNSNELVTRIDSFLVEIKEQKNNAGKLLYDDSFYEDLKTSMDNLKELTNILIEQLKNEGVNVDANIF